VPAKDLSHIEAWIFDLDNTLYPASANLFAQIDKRMKAFIAKAFGMTEDDAFKLQKRYYHAHGTTLRGLMINHEVDPNAFLDYVHDIDHSVLNADPHLDAALAGLPGRKFIYTNGSAYHARSVMDRLGVTKHFSGVYDIHASNYIPKPDPGPYVEMVTKHGIDAKHAIMFEDSHRNLKPAAALGMKTVWVRHPENHAPAGTDLSHCHYITDDLIGWLGGQR
jgi:putative hydrolase of the HAD superfamily